VNGHEKSAQHIVADMLLPAELIIAEAKRWGIADDVAIQVLPTGRINVLCRGRAGEAFAEHLKQVQSSGTFPGR
jgi:hypothetical protein